MLKARLATLLCLYGLLAVIPGKISSENYSCCLRSQKIDCMKEKETTARKTGVVSAGCAISAVTRDAQIPNRCGIRESDIRRAAACEVIMKCAKEKGHRDAIVLDLLLCSGLRVSEVCGIRPEDILNEKTVFVRGLKGSRDRVVTLQVMTDFHYFRIRCPWRWELGLNRWYIYRLCKEYGIYEQILGNKKLAVTHSGRHELIVSLQDAGLAPEEIAQVIGHKSVKSTEHYLKHKPVTGLVRNVK